MIGRFTATVFAVLLLAGGPAAAQVLSSVQVHLGMADLDAIIDGSKAVPLIEPTVETEPAFSADIDSYTMQVPDTVDGITLVLEAPDHGLDAMGVLDVNGVSGEFRSVTYSSARSSFLKGAIIPVRLEPGDNHIRFGIRHTFRGMGLYSLLVGRGTELPAEAGLAALALSRGALVPSFRSEVLSYRSRVAGHSVAVSAQAKRGGLVSVHAIGPAGRLLETDGFAVPGLGVGENAIIVSVTGADGSAARHYLIRAEASNIVHEVSAGDLVSMPDDCDGTVGCGGTLNGAEGQFACGRKRAAGADSDSESPDDAACSISLASDGGDIKIGSAVGWYFWAFPD